MVIYHTVKGSKETSWHNFDITVENMSVSISSGSYFRAGEEIIISESGATIAIPVSSEETKYEVWLTQNGIQVNYENSTSSFAEVMEPVDLMCWFKVDANQTDLALSEIHVRKVVS